jgi:hypothetical protein
MKTKLLPFVLFIALTLYVCSDDSNRSPISSSDTFSHTSAPCPYTKCNYLSKELLNAITASGEYTAKDSVAAYLKKYGELPSNYVRKSTAQELYERKTGKTFSKWNWNPKTTIGKMVGGDSFGNREGLLPAGSYYEADVDYYAANRGTNRLVYQTGEAIYSTRDHYESFSLIVWQ